MTYHSLISSVIYYLTDARQHGFVLYDKENKEATLIMVIELSEVQFV